MRKFSLLLFVSLSASVIQAASFYNGQAAHAVLGQNAFTDGYEPPTSAAANILGGTSGLAYYNGLLFVADDNRLGATPENSRVMIFDTTQIPTPYANMDAVAFPNFRCRLCGYSAVGLIGQSDYSQFNIGRSNLPTTTAGSMNQPVAVATDGHYFAIADANNNRVLLWNTVPTSQNSAPSIVLGQANFTAFQTPQPVNATSLRGPQGVWIQNNKLFIADTGNHRVLVWNSIPTQNNQPADFVLGQPNLLSALSPGSNIVNAATTASQLLNPASVSSDGTHLFVADLGFNRVLIWNSIPTATAQPADVVVGQASMTTSIANNSSVCSSVRTSATTGFPLPCEATLNFPRAVIAGGGKLFVADSGNDRILIWNSIPASNGTPADTVLGQPDFLNDIVTNQTASIASTIIDNTGAVDTVQSPNGLAFDGTNLYVSDPYNRRVVQFTPGDIALPNNSIVNWASEIIRQEGSIALTGTAVAADTATVTIAGTAYTYTLKTGDTLDLVAQGLVSVINANTGDPNAIAIFSGSGSGSLYLSSRGSNLEFDAISLAATTSNTTNLTATASGSYLTAGTAATGAPGMLVEINAPDGQTLADSTATGSTPNSPGSLPTTLAGVQVLVDGVPAPLLRVSPTQVVAQLLFALSDRSSASVFVKTLRNDGRITVTNATPVYVAPANPGLFNAQAFPGQVRPWPASGALHQLGNPNVVVSIDGSIKANDVATIAVNGTAYNYTVLATDTLALVTQNLVNLINNAPDPNVTASVGGAFTRVIVTARQAGAAGTGIPVTGSVSASASLTVTAYTAATCCNVPQGQAISTVSPAQPGELISLLGSGLGSLDDATAQATINPGGSAYIGPARNNVSQFVSATMNAVTAQVIFAGFPQFSYGIYYIQMIVPSTLTANVATPVYIAQNAFISNTVTIPVGSSGQSQGPTPTPTPISSLPNAIAPIAQIVVSPANLVFAVQNYANLNLGSQTVTIQNPSGGPLSIANISIAGTNASEFQVAQDCPTQLGATSSCTATISFSPRGTGLRTANLVIATSANNSPQTIPLAGTTTDGFEIVNQLTGKALEVPGGTGDLFVQVRQAEISNASFQKWSLISVGNNQYMIFNTSTGKVMDVAGGSTDAFAAIWQYPYVGGDNQKWTISPVDNGYFAITNVHSGLALDLAGGSFAEGATVWQYPYVGGSNQKWKFANYQTFQIQSVLTGSDVDVAGPSMDQGAEVHEWPAYGFPQQQWIFVPIDNTYFKIVNSYSHKVLDVVGASKNDFATTHQWEYAGTDNQLWTLFPQPNGAYAIISKGSGKALDIANLSPAPGTTIWQYTFTGAMNQQWKLIPTALP